MNYKELQEQLYSVLTEEERKEGRFSVTYDIGIATNVIIGEDDVECILRKTPYRDHVVGFKRGFYCIDLVLDEEGQKKWNAAHREAAEWIAKYGND